MLHRLALTALLGTASFSAPAQSFNVAKLDSLCDALATHHKLMGSLALTRAGHVVYSHAFGDAQLLPRLAATPATRYRVGSISKVFTAVMVFQLIEEGKLTLETPLSTFFPQLPNAGRITIDHLLSHHSGLHNFTDAPAFGSYHTQEQTQGEMLARIAKMTPDFAPGTKGEYSNTNFVLLGYVVEKLTDLSYAQALQKRVVAKAKLKSTTCGGKINPAHHEAFSYDSNGASGWKLSAETNLSIPGGAGAVVSTPRDLNRFLEALFKGKLVTASSLAAMQTMRDGYGRGLFLQPFVTKTGYGHGGVIDAFRSQTTYFPGDKLAFSVCRNGGSYSLEEVTKGALRIYYNQPYKLPNLAPYVPAPADLIRYAGTYASPQFSRKVTMTPDGQTLRSQATGQDAFLLEPTGPGAFRFEPAGISLTFDPDQPTFTFTQGGRSLIMTKE